MDLIIEPGTFAVLLGPSVCGMTRRSIHRGADASERGAIALVRAGQEIDVMAVVSIVTTLVWLLLALRFVDPTQIVAHAETQGAP